MTDRQWTSGPGSERFDHSLTADEGLKSLSETLGIELESPALLEQALSHRSWCGEQDGAPSNERLEFLGDAVLGLIVAEHCYNVYPDFPEGQLAKIRSAVVNARVLAEVAETLSLGAVIRLGKGEETSGGRSKVSILSDSLEAVIGAVYLDSGWEEAQGLVLRLLKDRIAGAASEPDVFDHKSRLQELVVRLGEGTPRYDVVGTGPDHDRRFVARVFVAGTPRGTGSGSSKKDAEQEAAASAWRELNDA